MTHPSNNSRRRPQTGYLSGNKNRQSSRRYKSYEPTVHKPTEGQITSNLTKFAYAFLQEMFNPEKKLDEYMTMAEKDPIVRACIELKCLRATLAFGAYQHEDSSVKEWVDSNLDNIQGNLRHQIGQLAGAMGMGFSVAEIVFSSSIPGYKNQWRFQGLNPLDPRRVKFEGKNGKIEWIRYRDGSGIDKRIRYSKVIHVVNGFGINFDNPFGSPEHATAYDFYKAKRALLSEMMVAGKNNATGIWWAKGDSTSTSQAFGSDGKPIKDPKTGDWLVEPSLISTYKQLLNLENNSIVVTDSDTEITPLQGTTAETFWNTNIQLLDNQIMTCYGVPRLVFQEGSSSFGVGTLGKQHRSVLDSQIEAVVLQIRDQMIEKVIRPLLVFNFGLSEDFGKFESDANMDPESQNMKVSNLINALSMQLLSTDDLASLNKLRTSLDLPELTEEQHLINKQQKLVNQVLEQQAAMGLLPAIPGVPESSQPAGPTGQEPPPEGEEGELPPEDVESGYP